MSGTSGGALRSGVAQRQGRGPGADEQPTPTPGREHLDAHDPGSHPATDPLTSLAVRAFALDATVLTIGVGTFVAVMLSLGRLADGPATSLTAAALVAGWLGLIMARGGYEVRYLGVGSEEFKRVVTASATLFAAISMAAYILPVAPPLRLVLPCLAGGALALLVGRWALRVWLGRQRLAGRFQQATLVVGDPSRTAELHAAFDEDVISGFHVVGAVSPPPPESSPAEVDLWLDEVMAFIEAANVHAVAVAESTAVAPDLLRRLAWRLEGPRIDLLVSPALSDVAGPRVSVRPASGLPLLHLDEPSLTGPKRALKRAMDLVIALPAVLLLAPLLIVVAVAIRLDSPGGAIYVSTRVGRAGREFGCLKFRSMVSGAEMLRDDVIGVPDEEISTRYRQDPRITRVGRLLRRWSLDELPQLLNVISGSMSLVGPRPMLPVEMGLLGDAEHRRHLTKPGLTGLWQISGRKEVAWDDRMHLDLHYVEHWSLALDAVILAKTAKAVLGGHGAY